MKFVIDIDYISSLLSCDNDTAEKLLEKLSSFEDAIGDVIDEEIKHRVKESGYGMLGS